MRAYIVSNGWDGCSWYRAIQPGRMLKASGLAQVRVGMPGDGPDRKARDLAWAEVVLIGRVFGKAMLELVRDLHEEGRAVVYDADDDLFNISPLNNSYASLGLDEVQVAYPGGKTDVLWADAAKAAEYPGLPAGRFIDLAENRANAEALRQALAEVDAITVTTDELARCYRAFGPPVYVLPNCVDLQSWGPLDVRRPRNEVRLGWAGGSSHYEDLDVIRPVLERVMAARPETRLWIQGVHFKSFTRNIDQERIRVWGWVHPEAHPWRSAALAPDIALIPLRDTEFNRRKSPIKWLEYAALGVPAVASDIPPYSPVVVHGVSGLLAGNADAWELHLLRLIDDPLYRAKLGGRAAATVRIAFDARANAHLWAEAMEAALSNLRRKAA